MDGIDRYFQPNTLDGLSIYDAPDALLVDGSNAMQADADMGGHNVKNVATATTSDEAVNLGQMNAALATKADDTLVVHKAGAETITGVKTFDALPETAITAVNPPQLVNLSTLRRSIPFHDLGYINYALPPAMGTYDSLLLASTVPISTSPLQLATVPRRYLYGSTILLSNRTTYTGAVIHCRQSYSYPPPSWIGATVRIAIYRKDNVLLYKTPETLCVDQSVFSITNRTFALGFGAQFTVPDTDLYIIVLFFETAATQWDFIFSAASNGDLFSSGLEAMGSINKYCQKAWYLFLGTASWNPPTNLNYAITTNNRAPWIGLI